MCGISVRFAALVLYIVASMSRATSNLYEDLRLVSLFTNITNISGGSSSIIENRSLWVPKSALGVNGSLIDSAKLTQLFLHIQSELQPENITATLNQTISIDKSSEKSPKIYFEIKSMVSSNNSKENETVWLYNGFEPGLRIVGNPYPMAGKLNSKLFWMFNADQDINVSYTAEPKGVATTCVYSTSLILKEYNTDGTLVDILKIESVKYCLEQEVVTEYKLFHEFLILILFLGIILAITLVIFLLLVFIIHRQKLFVVPYNQLEDEEKEYESHKSLIMTTSLSHNQQLQQTGSRSHDSIVGVLGKSPVNTFREINGWDIHSTLILEEQLETMKYEASRKIPVNLVQNMINRQEISTETGQKLIKDFNYKIEILLQNLDKDFLADKKELLREISRRNKTQLEQLAIQRRIAIEEVQKNFGGEGTRNQLQREYEEKEKDLVAQLELKQEHDMYSLNREYDLKKRKCMKNLEEELLSMVREESSLLNEKYEWLMEESERKQAEFQRIIEDIASKENAILHERHKKHQAMLEISNSQEVDYKHLMNKAVSNQRDIFQKLKRDEVLNDDETRECLVELHEELTRIKEEFEEKRDFEEKDLHEELSLERKRVLEDLENKHNTVYAEFEAEFKQGNDIDELTSMIEMKKIKSNQRIDKIKTEISLDENHVARLNGLRERLNQESIAAFEKCLENLISSLEKPECDQVVGKYIKGFKEDLEQLEKQQEEDRKDYSSIVKEKLEQPQVEMSAAEKEEEGEKEGESVMEDRNQLINELLTNQNSMSEEQRKKILDEHEMQKLRFEKSLTLNKLRQQSLLEERIVQKKRQRTEYLQQQEALATKQQFSDANNGKTESSTDQPSVNNEYIYISSKIEEINVLSDIDEVQTSLLKERELVKQEQEEKLGEIIVRLNLEKAKQMCQVKENSRIIDDMKNKLLQDFSKDGESQKLLEEHTKNQQKLQQQTEEQKRKFDEELMKKVEEKKIQQEVILTEKHEKEIRDVLSKCPNKTAALVRKLVLMNKHVIEREKLVDQMNVELKQNLQDLSHKYNMKIQTDLLKNEVNLILRLIAKNNLKPEDVFKSLNTPEDIKKLLTDIQNKQNGTQQSGQTMAFDAQIEEFVEKNAQGQVKNSSSSNSYFELPDHLQWEKCQFTATQQNISDNQPKEIPRGETMAH